MFVKQNTECGKLDVHKIPFEKNTEKKNRKCEEIAVQLLFYNIGIIRRLLNHENTTQVRLLCPCCIYARILVKLTQLVNV